MPLLDTHLEQISLSSAAISELPFPQPKNFTNALVQHHDITALIRDTEAHERALFTLAPPDQLPGVPDAYLPRRNTISNVKGAKLARGQRQEPAVAVLLGGELGDQIRKENSKEGKEMGEVDVNLLLKGAEKLCNAYPIAGGSERITSLRSRFEQLNASISRYESRVTKQTAQVAELNRHKDDVDFDDQDEDHEDLDGALPEVQVTEEDIRNENEEIDELEKKKRMLEDRVSGMERDLGGLLR
ncbi:uncharacterized protein KY384_006004 [Bacidia gigantensis]|uniref:uncharacterized protein n=1 Tax=Bacidia gigantensis TaxID=2732470 RepID=UPI001D03BA65|nr:uncharacterized protein KY384_006004 [Bacidia gigantensis]KAG8529368.1 hypothetical protein KY384_006004 [Bacidia gigantensis]